MAGLLQNLGNQFSSLIQLPGQLQKSQNAATMSNNAYNMAAQKTPTTIGPQFNSANAAGANYQGQTMQQGVNQPMGVTVKSPVQNVTPPTNKAPLGQLNMSPQTGSGSSIDYTLHPGESIDAYNSRIAGARTTSNDQGNSSTGTPPPTQPFQGNYTFDANGNAAGTQPANPPAPNQAVLNPQNNAYTNTGAPGYSPTVGALASTASQPSQAFLDAQGQAKQALSDLQTSRTNEAQALSLNSQNPIPLEFQQGRAGILQSQYQQQQNAYAQTYSGATAQEQAATGQQGAQQTGLTEAAGFQAPQPANALGTFNPVTGQYGQYGGAQGGGAAAAGAVATQIQQGGQVQQMAGQQAQAQSLAQNLNSLLNAAGINPNVPNSISLFQGLASGIQQWIDKQTGDPKYQNYANLVNEISSRYASILNQSGGTPTDQSTLSHSIINGLAKGQDIQTILQSLDKNATDSINALHNAANSNQANGTKPNTGGTTFGSFFGGKS